MTDYIKREDAIKAIEREAYRHDYLDHIIEIVDGVPSEDVAPVRHGRWIAVDYGDFERNDDSSIGHFEHNNNCCGTGREHSIYRCA